MVEVTQEDREAAASIAVLVEMRELIREGRADHHAEPFARRRIAARNAGLEEAAKVADEHCYSIDIDEWMAMTKKEHGAYACKSVATAIRNLKGPSNA